MKGIWKEIVVVMGMRVVTLMRGNANWNVVVKKGLEMESARQRLCMPLAQPLQQRGWQRREKRTQARDIQADTNRREVGQVEEALAHGRGRRLLRGRESMNGQSK
jgi:hypothetical protein